MSQGLCSPDYPKICSVEQFVRKLKDPPSSASNVLGLKPLRLALKEKFKAQIFSKAYFCIVGLFCCLSHSPEMTELSRTFYLGQFGFQEKQRSLSLGVNTDFLPSVLSAVCVDGLSCSALAAGKVFVPPGPLCCPS